MQNRANILRTKIDITGENEVVFEPGARLRNLRIQIRGHGNVLRIASGTLISGEIELIGDANKIEIGSGTVINGAFLGAHNGTTIHIGADCLFSTQIDLRTTDSHDIFDETGTRINPDKDIFIADRVWVGLNVTILKGTKIHPDCVIGTRSLVTGEIPANTISAGIPARVVKTGVTWKS